MTTCLVLGGAACVWDDVAAYKGPVDGVVACNDVGAEWPGELDGWASLHPNKFIQAGWIAKREANGYPPAKRIFGHARSVQRMRRELLPENIEAPATDLTEKLGSGSSGLFAAEVALCELRFDRVVLCGVPLDRAPHFFGGPDWDQHDRFRRRWIKLPEEARNRMGSMSGWTRELLGGPDMAKKSKKKIKTADVPAPLTRAAIRKMRRPELVDILEAHGVTEEQLGDMWIEHIKDLAERVVFVGI